MPGAVTLTVESYPFDGAVGLVVEERTSYGWVEVLDTSEIGDFPDYTTSYQVTATGYGNEFRYQWELSQGETSWLSPVSVGVVPTDESVERMTQAVIAKAARIYAMGEAPLGTHGEMTEFGMARVLPDYQIQELLAGLILVNWAVDLESLVTTADVIRALGYDDLPAAKEGDVERAITSAVSWVATYILGAVPVA